MRKAMLLILLFAGGIVHAQNPELDAYTHRFLSGYPINSQNFSAPSLEDMLLAKAYLFDLELQNLKMNNESQKEVLLTYGLSVYEEMVDYTQKFGRSTPSAGFLVLLANLRLSMYPFMGPLESQSLIELAREDIVFALRKTPHSPAAYMALARYYSEIPADKGLNMFSAHMYLDRAQHYAEQPFQRYQIHLLRAEFAQKEKKIDVVQKEIDFAARIYPMGKLHASYIQHITNTNTALK
ncbi:MAG: hypothetical protein ACRC9L_07065 [Brevinema sp.]